MIEQNELTLNYINTLLYKDAIMNVDDYMEDTFMSSNTKELLTVISVSDNPNLDLKIAQPCKYKFQKHIILGTGIIAYKQNAYSILKSQITNDEKIIKITVEFDTDKLLLCNNVKQMNQLRKIYDTMTEDIKKKIACDADFIDYVCKKSKQRYNAVCGIVVLGKPIYTGSTISDYLDTAFSIKNEDLIINAEECNR